LSGVDRENDIALRSLDGPGGTSLTRERRIETKPNASRIEARNDDARPPRFTAAGEDNFAPLHTRCATLPCDAPEARGVSRLPTRRRGPSVPPHTPRLAAFHGEGGVRK